MAILLLAWLWWLMPYSCLERSSPPSSSYTNTPAHVELARSYIGTQEQRKNRGPFIDSLNRFTGVVYGSPYCASFVSFIIAKAQVASPKIKTALAQNFWKKSKDRYSAGEVFRGAAKVRQGDIVIFARGTTRYGHVGIADSDWPHHSGDVVEANTGSPRGEGIWRKRRTIEPYNYFRIIGFAKVSY